MPMERFVPGHPDCKYLTAFHESRYHFARTLVKGMRVLDAGCGVGYGSAILSKDALDVTGVEMSSEAVSYAQSHYASERVTFHRLDVLKDDLGSQLYGGVVALEMIEHLVEQRRFLELVSRALRDDGRLIISTPNRAITEARKQVNPFHVHEFTAEEFRQTLEEYFGEVELYGQDYTESYSNWVENVLRMNRNFDRLRNLWRRSWKDSIPEPLASWAIALKRRMARRGPQRTGRSSCQRSGALTVELERLEAPVAELADVQITRGHPGSARYILGVCSEPLRAGREAPQPPVWYAKV